MFATRTPLLGIAIAVLILIAENVGFLAYVAAATDHATADRVHVELGRRGCHR